MATLPSPSQVARSQAPMYEGYYQQVDPAGTDHVAAVEAAAFLKRSALSDKILSKIWDMSDPQGKGYLDKKGFFIALKLIALSQNAKDMTVANLSLDVPPPQMSLLSGRNSPAIDWTIKMSERKKYEEMFYSMSPINGKLPGDKVKPVMLNSKLHVDMLGKIWDLSDTDQDGFLSKEEFILAMHLIYKALEGVPVPTILPPELTALLRRRSSVVAVPVLPEAMPSSVDSATLPRIRRPSVPSSDLTSRSQQWVINAMDKTKYDDIFRTLDTDLDGFVTGIDIRDTLLQSGLPQSTLAHIWNLCDIKQTGKLNPEQFSLAMYFIQQKLQGLELPTTLLPEMIPPTLRPKPVSDAIQDSVPIIPHTENDSTGNKELDLVGGEIKELQVEKMALEKDLAQKEADIKIKNGELKNCQNELDALETMLKQLEMQKGEARKRLNDLDNQKHSVDCDFDDLDRRVRDELNQIVMLKAQKEEQKANVEAQEEELQQKKAEVSELKQEETKLEGQISESKANLDSLTNRLQSTQLQISQIKLKMDQVTEQHRFMTEAIEKMDTALSNGDCSMISDYILNGLSPLHEINIENALPVKTDQPIEKNEVNGPVLTNAFQEDPFQGKDPFKEMNGFASDPFADEDPFKSADPFSNGGITAEMSQDPFANDPFQGAFDAQPEAQVDPFKGNDPFGADPFGAPPKPPSPTPALPPKKSKAPPPRPAPPKVATPSAKPTPTRAAPAPPVPPAPDPFKVAEASGKNSQGFSDLFSKPATNEPDPFDPFSAPTASAPTQDSFANFDNFADFDSVK